MKFGTILSLGNTLLFLIMLAIYLKERLGQFSNKRESPQIRF